MAVDNVGDELLSSLSIAMAPAAVDEKEGA